MAKSLGSALTGVARYCTSQKVIFSSASGRPGSAQGELVRVLYGRSHSCHLAILLLTFWVCALRKHTI